MPDIDPTDHLLALLDVKRAQVETLEVELARANVLLKNATSALAELTKETE